MKYFLDSYAFIEQGKGNPAFTKFFKGTDIVTSQNCLIEIFYFFLKEFNLKTARFFLENCREYTIDCSSELIENICLLKKQNKQLSYTDAQGYCMAQKEKRVFVTGDKAFKGMKGAIVVE